MRATLLNAEAAACAPSTPLALFDTHPSRAQIRGAMLRGDARLR
jgi:hypothetical protein